MTVTSEQIRRFNAEMGTAQTLQVLGEYRVAPRTEPCACGGFIVAGPSDDAIRQAVQGHYRTPQHASWRAERLPDAERELHLSGEPVPSSLLLRGRRCPCGGDS